MAPKVKSRELDTREARGQAKPRGKPYGRPSSVAYTLAIGDWEKEGGHDGACGIILANSDTKWKP